MRYLAALLARSNKLRAPIDQPRARRSLIAHRNAARRRRLFLEQLEDRRLLATVTVTGTGDTIAVDGLVTLREAITSANSNANVNSDVMGVGGYGDDVINFSVMGTINLSGALPDLNSNIQIQGPGAANLTVRRDTGGDYRIFTVMVGSTVELDGLTISNGRDLATVFVPLNSHPSIITGGGGIYNGGTLTVSNSTFSNNFSTQNGGGGGGIKNHYEAMLTVRNSTFSNNGSGSFGGGIFNNGATLTVSNSTFADNWTTGGSGTAGGGINNYLGTVTVSNSTFTNNRVGDNQTGQPGWGGGISSGGTGGKLTVVNSTFADNTARNGGGGIFNWGGLSTVSNSTLSGNSSAFFTGGGIRNIGTNLSLTVQNTIIAKNTAPAGGPDFSGYVTSSGNNLIGDDSGSSGWGLSDLKPPPGLPLMPLNPLLAQLGNYGGPTQTMALLPGSPAIDAGNDALVPPGVTTDQRGMPYSRINGVRVDIGAFETSVDTDGVSDALEDAGPNGGDGNSDSIPDSQQSEVTSLPNSADQQYVTLVSATNTNMVAVAAIQNPSPANSPAGIQFPIGHLEFTVENVSVGNATTVTLILPDDTMVNTYYKYGRTVDDPTPHWYEFLFDGLTGAEIFAGPDADTEPEIIILHFVDGQRGDDDLSANGQLKDPGGPAFRPNSPPIANAGGPYSIAEGSSLSLDGSGSYDPDLLDTLTYSWDVNGDGVFGDASGVSQTLSWAQLQMLGINDGPLTVANVRVRVDDGQAHVVDSPVTMLTVTNVEPVMAGFISGPATAVPGQSVSYSVAFTDVGSLDSHTVSINWGDGNFTSGTVTETIGTGIGSAMGSHTYAGHGIYTITFTLTDDDQGFVTKSTSLAANPSIFVLHTTAAGAFTASGNGTVNVTGVVVVDSNSPTAITASGNVRLTASKFNVVGGIKTNGNAQVIGPVTNTFVPDPLAGLATPALGTVLAAVSVTGNSSRTINPGTYTSISVSGNGRLTLNPGVYILAGGGFSVSGNGSVTGNEISIVNTASANSNTGSISFNGNGAVTLTPATSGPLTGVLIFQPSSNTKALTISGDAATGLNGTIYAPKAQLSITGNGTFSESIIVDRLTINGNGSNLASLSQPLAFFGPSLVLPVSLPLDVTSPSAHGAVRLPNVDVEENQARDQLFASFDEGPAKLQVRSQITSSKSQFDAPKKSASVSEDLLDENLLEVVSLARLAIHR